MQLTDYHAKYYAHELTKRCSSDSIEKLAASLADAQVDLNPHQVDAALFAFRSPLSRGAILADEVGLGKTIEAGIVLSQIWAERKRKILIIVPSSLRKQWSQELSEKFFLPSTILESKSFNQHFKNVGALLGAPAVNPFEQTEIIITSYQFARNKGDQVRAVQWDLVVIVKPHTEIERHNLTKIQADNIHHYTDTITPTNTIPQKVFSGFKKACHTLYKFDAKGEKDFATILENDKDVIKWLRPAPKQFHIYWDHNARTYEPDFVIESGNIIYLTEIKANDQMTAPDVLEKAKAAVQYCKHATDHNLQNGGKEWKYLLIPHSEVQLNSSVAYLAMKREFKAT